MQSTPATSTPATRIPATSTPATRIPATRIRMVTPAQVCQELVLDEQQLLAMVNDGSLPAYDLGGQIRFKDADVASLIGLLEPALTPRGAGFLRVGAAGVSPRFRWG